MSTRIDGCSRIHHVSFHDDEGGPRQAVLGDIHPLVFAVHAWTDSGFTPRTLRVTAFSTVEAESLRRAQTVALVACQPGGMRAHTLEGMRRRIAERLRTVQDLNVVAALREADAALKAYALNA